jgi:hypothetical protein
MRSLYRELTNAEERFLGSITGVSIGGSRSVPDAMQMDRLLRYGTSLDPEIDRTLKQLERRQRLRLCQPLPPSIEVNVSSEE